VAVVLDLGVVDTGHAAGTPGLNVGGMSALDLLDTLRALAARARIVAMATIGLAPERDPRGHSELLAAEALSLSSMSARGLGSQS
jgi:arginase family enzyme